MKTASENKDLLNLILLLSLMILTPQGGRHGTKKGAKGYNRKAKHKGREG